MIRIAEYWELWAARLEVEIARAWRRGDQRAWQSLRDARQRALRMAEELRAAASAARPQAPLDMPQPNVYVTSTNW